MPTYQYRCAQCGEQFDVWQSIHDDALIVHDGDCGGALSKVLSVGGIVLKGPGFYRTDNRSMPATRDGDSSKSGADKAGAGGGNGTGDSKPGDGTDSKSSEGSSSSRSEAAPSGASKSDTSPS